MCLPHVQCYFVQPPWREQQLLQRNSHSPDIWLGDPSRGRIWIRKDFRAGTDITLITPGLTIQLCMGKKKEEMKADNKERKGEKGARMLSSGSAARGPRGPHSLEVAFLRKSFKYYTDLTYVKKYGLKDIKDINVKARRSEEKLCGKTWGQKVNFYHSHEQCHTAAMTQFRETGLGAKGWCYACMHTCQVTWVASNSVWSYGL